MTQNHVFEYYFLKERQLLKPLVESKILTHGKSRAEKMKSTWLSVVAILALAVSMCFVLPVPRAYAVDCSGSNLWAAQVAITNWSSNTANTWACFTGGSWQLANTGQYPGQSDNNDTVYIRYPVTLNTSVTIAALYLGVTPAGLGAYGNGTLTFDNNNRTLTVNGAVTIGSGGANARTGSIDMTNAGTLIANSFTVTNGGTWTPGAGTVQLQATNTLPSSWLNPFNNLTISAGTTTLGMTTDVNGNLTIGSGTGLNVSGSSYAMNVAGNWTNNGGTFTPGTGTVTFDGGSTQALGGSSSTTFYNLTINNAAGITLGANETVSNILTFTSGNITTGTNTLEVSASCAIGVSGGSATSYVFGNLRLHYPTAGGTTTCTFPIGDATTYAPVQVDMLNVTSTLANSTLTARTDTPDHADTTAGTSGIDKNYSVNRYWTLTPGGSLTFTTYNPTFNFVAGDIDSGATPANFVIARKNLGVWSYPTAGTRTATSTQATGITQVNGFGEFAVGEASSISGTVFEDINYGGGGGRSLAGSAGVPVANVRVELYDNAGNYLTATTTNAGGVYSFSRASGTYTVRVASNGATGIRSTRTGGAACTTCVPVQTYRTDATSGTANPVTDHVGGETPTLVDAIDNTTSAILASLTTATTTAQSITTVTKGTASITGVDFGFNFDTIVSIRDASQGSLRQFIINANALGGEGTLAQVGQTAGQETSIFMIPHATAVPGQNIGYADQLTSGGANNGAAVITLTTGALPAISGNNTSIEATTQTTNVGDTNSGTVGTGGTVGTMAQALSPFNRPEVVISGAATQLTASGTTVIIKGLAIANGGITVNGSNSQVRDCLSGMNADGTVTTVYGANFAVQCGPGTGILVSHNYTKVNNSSIRGDSPGANLTIEYNEIDSPNGTPGGGHTNTFDGILIVGTASNVTVRYNLVRNQRGGGLEYGFAGGTVISGTAIGNTITINGFASAGTRSTEPVGVVVWQLNATSALTIQQNVITGNAGPGLVVIAATNVTITQNSIFTNGSLATDIGIDLNSISGDPNTYTAQGVTLNESGDGDTGPNGLLNYPIIETAIISASNLILRGWARPGSIIEFFIATPDPSGFGEGRTYLATLTEGSGADTDATSSTYGPGAINSIAQGTDTTNRFMFTIPTPGGVAIGTVLTATAILSGNTSEFSGNVTVVTPPVLTVVKSADKISAAPGDIITYTALVTNTGGGKAYDVVMTDSLSPYVQGGLDSYGAGVAFQFVQGTPSSGLTLGTPVYSNDGGSTWVYTPVSGGGGAPAGYDGNITNWSIPMSGTMDAGGANFTINYKVRVK